MVTNRITISISPEITDKVREFQGRLLKATNESWSFSRTLTILAEHGLKEDFEIYVEELKKRLEKK